MLIITGENAPQLEQFAATELQSYLRQLFGLDASIALQPEETPGAAFLLGILETNPAMAAALQGELPSLSEQGFLLRRIQWHGQEALALLGGSPRAVLWAVYHLVEQWGVRYLLHGDAMPENPGPFHLPEIDLIHEPALPVRQWRLINDFACGPESWGMEHCAPVIDQLAKLKFNRIFLALYPWQPFLHYGAGGIERCSAALWFNFHYPITDDMVGRELFGDEEEFWNPDLPRGASYQEFAAAGEQYVHALLDHARSRGMECGATMPVTEFPPEFAPLLQHWQPVHQLAEMGIVPGAETEIEDPALNQLSGAILKALANTYPELDFIALGMPEFRQWLDHYHRAWQALDQRYGLEAIRALDEVLAAAQERTGYPGGAERAVQEVKGDIVALYFYDRLLRDLQVFADTRRPDMRIVLNSVAEELYPVLPRLVPDNAEILNFVDYTASRILHRRDVLQTMPTQDIPTSLIYTLHDDNVGLLPQITTGSLHQLTMDLRKSGWAGFSTRYWLIADHDPCVAYLARASWEEDLDPETIYRDQIEATCGADCVDDMLTLFAELEAVTLELEEHGLGLAFPVPDMMMKHWTPAPISDELIACRQGYQRALDAAQRAGHRAPERGRPYVDYWVGRLEFGLGYLDAIKAARNAAMAESENDGARALRCTEDALEQARQALAAYARIARDQSDCGALAVLNEYVYRPLVAKVKELQQP